MARHNPDDSYVIQLQKTIADQRRRIDKFEKLFKKVKPSHAHIKSIQEQRKNKKETPPINIKSLFKEYSHNFVNKTTFHNIPGVDLNYTNNNEDTFEPKVKQLIYNEILQQVNLHIHVKVMISATAVFMSVDGRKHEISQRLKTFEVTYMKNLNLNNKFDFLQQMLLEVEDGDTGLKFQHVKEYRVNIVKIVKFVVQ